MRNSLTLLTIFAVGLASATGFAAPPPGKGGGGNDGGGSPPPFTYTIVDLGNYPGAENVITYGLNDVGDVVGYAVLSSSDPYISTAVIWSPGTGWVELESLLSAADQDAWDLSHAVDINNPDRDTGRPAQVCGLGAFWGKRIAFRMTLTAGNATIEPVGTEAWVLECSALAINQHGDMAVGVSDADNPLLPAYYSDADLDGDGAPDGLTLIDEPEMVQDVFVKDINLFGQVVGQYEAANGEWLGFRFTPGQGLETFLLPGAEGSCGTSELLACNDVGEVCGSSQTLVQINKKHTACEQHAIVFDDTSGELIDLGTFGRDGSMATDINNSSEIIGFAFTPLSTMDKDEFIVIDGTGYLLEDLVTNANLSNVAFYPRRLNEFGDVICNPWGGAPFLLLRN